MIPLKVVHGRIDSDENLLLEAYILELERTMGNIVARQERDSYSAEVRGHLEQAIRTRMESGATRLVATQGAIERLGTAKTNAEEFLASWFEYENRTPLSKRFGKANLTGYMAFQFAEVLCLLLFQINVFEPSEASYQIPFSPAKVRSLWPEPLPFPDFSLRFYLLIGTPILVPIIAGWIVGKLVPVRAAKAAYNGLIPLLFCSFVMGALLLPMTEALLFALFQIVFWLPVGCLTAHISSTMSRNSSCRDHALSRASQQHLEPS